MSNPPKKKRKYRKVLSKRQKKALEILSKNGGNMGDALDKAGYSPSIVKNPQKVFRSKAFAQVLERSGVTDMRVGKKYSRLLDSSKIEHEVFYGVQNEKGEWKYPSHDKIRKIIEGDDGETGCILRNIQVDHKMHEVIVTYLHPENVVQKGMVELVGKVRSHFAPEKLEVEVHELDESERKLLQGIIGK